MASKVLDCRSDDRNAQCCNSCPAAALSQVKVASCKTHRQAVKSLVLRVPIRLWLRPGIC